MPEVSETATKIKREVKNGIIVDVLEKGNKSPPTTDNTPLNRPQSEELAQGILNNEY